MKDYDKESTSSDVKTILATIALVISILGTAMLVYLVFIFILDGIFSLQIIPMSVCVGINIVAYILGSIVELKEDCNDSVADKRAGKAKSIAGLGIGLVIALAIVIYLLTKF
jgi:hypothetical protein